MKKSRRSGHSEILIQSDPPCTLHHIRVNEARAQVSGQKADGIREEWGQNTITSDAELLLKIEEARYARETSASRLTDQMGWESSRRKAMQELLAKATLNTPVHPPKHARFAIFLLPRAYQHIIFGDLEEQYPTWVKECGRAKATFLYWWQFLLSTAVIGWPRIRVWRYAVLVLWLVLRILKAWHGGLKP